MLQKIRNASTQELRQWLKEVGGRPEWWNTEATLRNELERRNKIRSQSK